MEATLMCYSGCQYENRNGGCNKPANIICMAEFIPICKAPEQDCVFNNNTICENISDCKFKKYEVDK